MSDITLKNIKDRFKQLDATIADAPIKMSELNAKLDNFIATRQQWVIATYSINANINSFTIPQEYQSWNCVILYCRQNTTAPTGGTTYGRHIDITVSSTHKIQSMVLEKAGTSQSSYAYNEWSINVSNGVITGIGDNRNSWTLKLLFFK